MAQESPFLCWFFNVRNEWMFVVKYGWLGQFDGHRKGFGTLYL